MGASVPYAMPDKLITTRTGRLLEVREYGDPAGHPALFFHGLIGSHHQASYIAEQAMQHDLRIIAPNRPGVGKSEFVERKSALEAVPDIEDLTAALQIDQFSVIGISGGTPYALACLHRLGPRIRTTTVISGMGPLRLSGALQGMDRPRRLAMEIVRAIPGWPSKDRGAGPSSSGPTRPLFSSVLYRRGPPPTRSCSHARRSSTCFFATSGRSSSTATAPRHLPRS